MIKTYHFAFIVLKLLSSHLFKFYINTLCNKKNIAKKRDSKILIMLCKRQLFATFLPL